MLSKSHLETTLLTFFALVSTVRGAPFETRFVHRVSEQAAKRDVPVRSILARRCITPPDIDGSLRDPAWLGADAQADFTLLADVTKRMLRAVAGDPDTLALTHLPAARPVTVRLLYDERRLYVGFDIDEPSPQTMKRSFTRNDQMLLWSDDTAELLLDPDADRKRYFHFMINANSKVTDGEFGPGIGRLDRMKWTSRWECATSLADGKWVVEIAIPFEDLRVDTPVPGSVWLGNFCHHTYNRFKRKLPSGMEVASDGEAASWMPLDKQFHEVWSLGEIVFDRAPTVKIISLDWNEPAWGRNVADVVLRNQSDDRAPVTVSVAGLTPSPVRVVLGPRAEVPVQVPYAIGAKGKAVALKLEVTSGGKLVASRQRQAELAPNIFEIRPREEVLWTGERSLPLDFRLHAGVAALPDLSIRLTCGDASHTFVPKAWQGTCVIPVTAGGPVSIATALLHAGRLVAAGQIVVRRQMSPAAWR